MTTIECIRFIILIHLSRAIRVTKVGECYIHVVTYLGIVANLSLFSNIHVKNV